MSLHIPDIVFHSPAIRAKVFPGWEGRVEMMADQGQDSYLKAGNLACTQWPHLG